MSRRRGAMQRGAWRIGDAPPVTMRWWILLVLSKSWGPRENTSWHRWRSSSKSFLCMWWPAFEICVVQVEQGANDGRLYGVLIHAVLIGLNNPTSVRLYTTTEVCALFKIRSDTLIILFRSGVVTTRATASPSLWKNFDVQSTIPASKTAASCPFLRSIRPLPQLSFPRW